MRFAAFLALLYTAHVVSYLVPAICLTKKEVFPDVYESTIGFANLLVYGPVCAFPLLWTLGPTKLWSGSHLISALNILNALLWSDILFYLVHRLFHTRHLYKFHSMHHQWNNVEPFAAFDASIIEHCAANILPFVLSALACNLGQLEFIYFVSLVTSSSVLAHWSQSGPHALHHRDTSVNFGAGFFLLDKLCGTFQRAN